MRKWDWRSRQEPREGFCILFQVQRAVPGRQCVTTIPPQKLHDITSRAEGRMLEGRVMMEEHLVSSENSGILEELCLAINDVVTCGVYSSSISTVNVMRWPSKKNLKNGCFKRKFWVESLWHLQVGLISHGASSTGQPGWDRVKINTYLLSNYSMLSTVVDAVVTPKNGPRPQGL